MRPRQRQRQTSKNSDWGFRQKRAGFTIVEEYYESYKRDLFLIRQQQSCRFFCWAMCLGSYSRRPALKLWSLR
jgi:hypothetical protein